MFIIDGSHRAQGMGRELFKAGMAEFKRNGVQIVGLDGVVEQKATYERRGFESPLGTVKIMMRPLVAKEPLPFSSRDLEASGQLVDIHDVPKTLLAQHDLKYTGFDRPELWSDEHMFNRPDVSGVALVGNAKPETPNDLQAWTILRRCSGGIRLGPLYADSQEATKLAVVAAMEKAKPILIKSVPLPKEPLSDGSEAEIAEQATLVTEVWGGNPEAVQLFEGLGWIGVVVEYHRMWVGSKATPEFNKGGLAQKGCYAVFDAATG
jgi:hypothetical protein